MNSQRSGEVNLKKMYFMKHQRNTNRSQHHISINVEDKKSLGKLSKSKENIRALNPYDDDLTLVSDTFRQRSIDKSCNIPASSLSSFTLKYNSSVRNQLEKWMSKRHKVKKYHDIDADEIFQKVKHQIAIAQSYSKNQEHLKIDSLVKRRVDLMPEIPVYCKIPCKDEYSPCKITLTMNEDKEPDIYSFSSLRVPMPSANKCSKSWKNSHVLKVYYNYEEVNPHDTKKRDKYRSSTSLAEQFTNHFIYIGFLSYSGASMMVDVKFANEYGTFGTKKFTVTKESENKKALEAVEVLKHQRENKHSSPFLDDTTKSKEPEQKLPKIINYLRKPYEERKINANERRHKLFLQKITKIEMAESNKQISKKLQRLIQMRKVCAAVMMRQLFLQKYILHTVYKYTACCK
ncbi:unnamed protein product [Moneuplotes crassus]|uniref:Uncharacterized protein n=1 Tax=Euplotes crassus TaxID=5936 RepID=A0AAD1U7T0_EUPCR|nr:unnamed protein product [Moneuplotes crassus]